MRPGNDTLGFIEDILLDELAAFLGKALPRVAGEQWWQRAVLDQLRGESLETARYFKPGEVGRLDIASLVYITTNNWRALQGYLNTRETITSYLYEIKDFRNKIRHDRGARFSDADLTHVLQSAAYVVGVINPESEALERIRERMAALAPVALAVQAESEIERAPEAVPVEAPVSVQSEVAEQSGGNASEELSEQKPPLFSRRSLVLSACAAGALVLGGGGLFWRFRKSESEFDGRVMRVVDGDTVEVMRENGETLSVHLAGVDAPEPKQEYGQEAAAALSGMLAGRRVRVRVLAVDRYKRPIVLLDLNGEDVAESLVRSGSAWVYRKYLSSLPETLRSRYIAAENEAKSLQAGLWANPDSMPPWAWRHRSR
ncbi:MAG: thermonuclease family protein [Oscillospiraceae bacterium]|nr:thermonuclease family protein [Oscillospiraceae bacterium]